MARDRQLTIAVTQKTNECPPATTIIEILREESKGQIYTKVMKFARSVKKEERAKVAIAVATQLKMKEENKFGDIATQSITGKYINNEPISGGGIYGRDGDASLEDKNNNQTLKIFSTDLKNSCTLFKEKYIPKKTKDNQRKEFAKYALILATRLDEIVKNINNIDLINAVIKHINDAFTKELDKYLIKHKVENYDKLSEKCKKHLFISFLHKTESKIKNQMQKIENAPSSALSALK